jgi:hypothetical protein
VAVAPARRLAQRISTISVDANSALGEAQQAPAFHRKLSEPGDIFGGLELILHLICPRIGTGGLGSVGPSLYWEAAQHGA